MAANLHADGRIWKCCRFCRRAIWRYPKGQLWRDESLGTTCTDSRVTIHVPEY